jgi:hypothetical protein
MAWTTPQKTLAHIAKSQIGWNDPQYRLVLRNAGVRPHGGKVSAAGPFNDNAAFERFMAIAERSGFIDSKNGQGYWSNQVERQKARIHYRILDLAGRAVAARIVEAGFLAGYVERMTQERPQGPTRELSDCDWEYSFNILEGLKAWTNREARTRGISLGA